jgi:hypothetical protein
MDAAARRDAKTVKAFRASAPLRDLDTIALLPDDGAGREEV